MKKKTDGKTPPNGQIEPAIEVWRDPEWEPALDQFEGWTDSNRYTGKSDPKPLARLLRSGKPVPAPVAHLLGVLLDPPWGKNGSRLALNISKRYSGQRELKLMKEMIDLQKQIEESRSRFGKLEAAIADVAKKTGKSRSHLMKAWKYTLGKGIAQLARYNPQPSSSPRESGNS
jgi:hypothetical protein